MAKVYSLSVKNTTKYTGDTASTQTHFDPVKIVASDYAIVQDEAGVTEYTNMTTDLGADEVISRRVARKNGPKADTKVKITYPAPSTVPYVNANVRLDVVLSETDSSDPSFRYDYPIVGNLSLYVPATAGVDDTLCRTICERMIGMMVEPDTTDPTEFVPTFTKLIKGATKMA